MIYAMSDIHGEKGRFDRMLKLISFSKKDTLYVIGDAIDRGPDGIAILQEIMQNRNMVLLMGNHEEMCVSASKGILPMMKCWSQNGGDITSKALDRLGTKRKKKLLSYMESAPEYLDITVNGKNFHLVHACPGLTRETRLWQRPDPNHVPYLTDFTVIVGHTATMFFHPAPLSYLRRISHMEIFKCNAFIGIDCGCGMPETRKDCLACLRLDDMQEFYII